jgi:glycosyltransferase involved in cell wall biosynthesis
MERELRTLVTELRLEEKIIFLGWLGQDELRKEMRHAALLVTPSRMIEGQNLVVTEALSVGCPVATTPRGGVLDLVKDEETGFIIPEPTARSISSKVKELLQRGEQLAIVGKAGFTHFTSNFSRQRITMLTQVSYKRALDNS